MLIYCIVVTYNGMNWIAKCMESLINSSIPLKILIIDNGSVDGTHEFISTHYPDVEVINNGQNLGFAKANNIGIKYILNKGADYLFLLNQDARIEKNTIEELIHVFDARTDAGVVSPIHLNGNNTGLDKGFANYISSDNTPNIVSDLYMGKIQPFYETNFVNAAAWLMNRNCIETVGGFDTSLFYHCGEDNNFCQRVLYHNLKIFICTTTSIFHDREVHDKDFLSSDGKQDQTLYQKVYFADLSLDDSVVEGEIKSQCYRFRRKTVKYFLLFKVRKLRMLYRERKVESKLFSKIMISRKINKIGRMVWINASDIINS
jgi:GT2 family glycosyltransferase